MSSPQTSALSIYYDKDCDLSIIKKKKDCKRRFTAKTLSQISKRAQRSLSVTALLSIMVKSRRAVIWTSSWLRQKRRVTRFVTNLAGYPPELAYFECLHETKLIVDLIYEGGIANMNYSISNNAEYGEYVTGEAVVNDSSREAMRTALKNIQNGDYAKSFIQEGALGYPSMTARRRNMEAHQIEQIGGQLREMMPWIAANKIVDKDKN